MMIRLKTTQALLFIVVLLVSIFVPLIVPNMPTVAEAAVPGGSIQYLDQDTILINALGGGGGKGFRNKQINGVPSSGRYDAAEITYNLSDTDFCSVRVTIQANLSDRSRGKISLAAPNVLPLPDNTCDFASAFSAWGGAYSNQDILIGNSEVFDGTPTLNSKKVRLCSSIPLNREGSPQNVARVSEFFDRDDTLVIKRGNRTVGTLQGELQNPDSRSDTHARFCRTFDDIEAGNYKATSRFAFTTVDFEKVARETANVTITGENTPVLPGEAPAPGAGGEEENPPSCEEENPGISLSWFICSVINFFDNTILGLTAAVDDLLQVPTGFYTDSDLRQAWAYFRNIASFLLIIIGLVMIIGQAVTKD